MLKKKFHCHSFVRIVNASSQFIDRESFAKMPLPLLLLPAYNDQILAASNDPNFSEIHTTLTALFIDGGQGGNEDYFFNKIFSRIFGGQQISANKKEFWPKTRQMCQIGKIHTGTWFHSFKTT